MPAVSKAQQKFMGMVHGLQKGTVKPSKVSGKVKKVAKSMKKKSAKDFASTKHKGLPKKVKSEAVNEVSFSSVPTKKLVKQYKQMADEKLSGSAALTFRMIAKELIKRKAKLESDVKEGFGGELKGKARQKFEKARQENAEVLGYKLTGTKDIKESIKKALHEDMDDAELAGRIKHWASKHKGTGIGYGHVLGQLAVHMKEMGWSKSFKEVVKVAKELAKKKTVESTFAVKGKEDKDGYKHSEKPDFEYDPEKEDDEPEDKDKKLSKGMDDSDDYERKFKKESVNEVDISKIRNQMNKETTKIRHAYEMMRKYSGDDVKKADHWKDVGNKAKDRMNALQDRINAARKKEGYGRGEPANIYGIEYLKHSKDRKYKKASLTMSSNQGKKTFKKMTMAILKKAEQLKKQEGWAEYRITVNDQPYISGFGRRFVKYPKPHINEVVNEAKETGTIKKSGGLWWAVFDKRKKLRFEGNVNFMVKALKIVSGMSKKQVIDLLKVTVGTMKGVPFKADFSKDKYVRTESVDEAKETAIDVAKRVVKNKQHEKGLDLTTANFIVKIYDAYKEHPNLQRQMDKMPLPKMVKLAYRVMK